MCVCVCVCVRGVGEERVTCSKTIPRFFSTIERISVSGLETVQLQQIRIHLGSSILGAIYKQVCVTLNIKLMYGGGEGLACDVMI